VQTQSSPPSPQLVARPSPCLATSPAQGIIEAAIKNYGRLDIFINNSGVYELAPIEAITEEHFHRHFNINVLASSLRRKPL
jgi:NAD(P)-dependent dehydrogenase (short-subunit alcohol dehydrogenase family)